MLHYKLKKYQSMSVIEYAQFLVRGERAEDVMAMVNDNACLQHLTVLQELLAGIPDIMEMQVEQDIKDKFLAIIDTLSQDA